MWRWLAGHPWVTSLVTVVLVVAAAGFVVARQAADRDAFAACVASWANDTAARSATLGSARSELDAANDILWRAFAELLARPQSNARETFQGLLGSYVGASDRYRARVRDNPAPQPPRLACE